MGQSSPLFSFWGKFKDCRQFCKWFVEFSVIPSCPGLCFAGRLFTHWLNLVAHCWSLQVLSVFVVVSGGCRCPDVHPSFLGSLMGCASLCITLPNDPMVSMVRSWKLPLILPQTSASRNGRDHSIAPPLPGHAHSLASCVGGRGTQGLRGVSQRCRSSPGGHQQGC